MSINKKDYEILRKLAEEYARIALSDTCAERVKLYRELNSLKQVRPPVLIFEIPWGEFSDCEELTCLCEDSKNRATERQLREELYKWNHFQGDYTIHPYWRAPVAVKDSGYGLNISEQIKESETGTHIMSHMFNDLLPDEASLETIKFPVITHDLEETNRRLDYFGEIFKDLLPVKKAGINRGFGSWDLITRLHGVEESVMDLCCRPEYSHAIIERFTQIHLHELDEFERLNVLDTDPYYIHCTPAATYDLPILDMDKDKITTKDVWCRAMAQIFSVVPPDMHDEFDLQYTKRLFDRCGLSYYGCCEPLDEKIDNLRQFKNLRRISITPWANAQNAAEKIGKDYVMSFKPNPAFVAGANFDPNPVAAEIKNVVESCLKNGTPFEFILKDISTVANNPQTLVKWLDTVNGVINSYF